MKNLLLTAAILAPGLAFAQSGAEAAAASQSIAMIGGGGGSGDRLTGVATTSDSIAPSISGMQQGSCVVPKSSTSVTVFFLSWSSGDFDLDRYCQSLKLAEASVGIAYARADLQGVDPAIDRNLDRAEMLVSAATTVFMRGTSAWSTEPWEELWRP